jgi:hypothetical protein
MRSLGEKPLDAEKDFDEHVGFPGPSPRGPFVLLGERSIANDSISRETLELADEIGALFG